MELIRTTHPLYVFAIAWLVLLAIDRTRQAWPPSTWAVSRIALLTIGLAALAVFGVITIWYACQVTYFDAAEPTITAVSSIFGAGKPLYPALDAPERYVHIYGPVLFMTHAAALAILGHSIVVSKAVGVVAVLVSLLLAYRVFAEESKPFGAILATAMCAAIYLDFGNASFWTRPDPLLILCASAGLYGARLGRRLSAILVLGLAVGLAVNLKASGPVYLLPALGLVVSRRGWRAAAAALGLAAVVATAPFLISNISLTNYLQYIQVSAGNGLLWSRFRQNIEWTMLVAAPLVGAWWGRRSSHIDQRSSDIDQRMFLASLAMSLGLIVVIAAKPGAGPYHLLPSVTALAFAVLRSPAHVWDRSALRSLVAAVGVTAVVMAVPRQATFLETVRNRQLDVSIDDIRVFADAHPSSRIAVGYAGTSRSSDARTEMVFRSGEYWLDAPAVQEYRLSGLELPESTIRAIHDCREDYWLIPLGAEPFAVPSAYWPAGPPEVFPQAFRDAFLGSYEVSGHTVTFNVWSCKAKR